ncbi:NYN domain-containing protein [Actinomadura madurae]|uniref:NYN domain-containing protein n=1 Tax=Actinomadura madurae TaxID=1993 RepID=UPI003FD73F3C
MLGKHTGHRRPGRSGIIDSGPEATSGGEAPEPSGAERLRRPMPEAVRQGVVEVAADLIGTLPAEEVPAPLRRFARFERRKRAKLAGQHIAAMLEKDAGFRRRVAGPLREAQADLAEAVEDGDVPPAADPVRVAVLGYLLRPAGWTELVEAAREELERSATASEEEAAERRVAALKQELAAARAARGAELDKLRGELRETKAEVAELRRKLHEARTRFRAAEERADAVAAEAGRELAAARESTAASEKELRRLRARTAQAEAAAEAAKRAAREGRNVDDVRLRMLLDALVDAAQGVRRELALPSTIGRPADAVGGLEPDRPAHRALPGRALSDNDPQLLDRLLTLPQVHLVVDGYNVTKTGYGELPLSDQRSRAAVRARRPRRADPGGGDVRVRRRGAGRAGGDRGAARCPGAVQPPGADGGRADRGAGSGGAAGPFGGRGVVRPGGGRRGAPRGGAAVPVLAAAAQAGPVIRSP